MKLYYGFDNCPNCGKTIDCIATRCPHCHVELTQPAVANPRDAKEFHRFENYVQVSFIKEMILFLTGWLGFKLLGMLAGIIAIAIGAGTEWGDGVSTLQEWSELPAVNFWINASSYMALFIVVGGILWRDGWIEFAHSYKKIFNIAIGVAGLIATIVTNTLYSLIVTGIFAAFGREMPSINGNEQTIRDMIFTNLPLAYLVFGIIGPFTEEITYRVGLFSFFGRSKGWIAYLISCIIFGLIHLKWENLGTTEGLASEFIALPTYIGGGAILAFVYEKGGISASYTSHMLNNILSLTLTVAGVNNG